MPECPIRLAAVVGPTASGKTRLAIALANALDGEIVSMDSMQIYRGMDIGTAKPSKEERAMAVHHLVDFVDPDQAFSVADYVDYAHKTIADISSRGRLPILVGGTGLYFSSVVDSIQFSEVPEYPEIRKELYEFAEQYGNQALHEKLGQVDPQSAVKIHPNNLGRVVRALEVYRVSGLTMTEHRQASRKRPSPYQLCAVGITYRDRQTLYCRTDRRVDEMMRHGLLEEARAYFSLYGSGTSAQAIGYKELQAYFDGVVSLDQAVETIKRETRRYAKRQLTWFCRDSRVQWLYADDYNNFSDLENKAIEIMEIYGILKKKQEEKS